MRAANGHVRRMDVLSADRLKRHLLLTIIALSLFGTVVSWWVFDTHERASAAQRGVHDVSLLVLSALLLVSWRRWVSQRLIEQVCLIFGVLACAVCMALRLYWPRYGGDINLQSLYLWIPVLYVLAFTLADGRRSLQWAMFMLGLFGAISLPYLWQSLDTPAGNLNVQLHVVSAVLVAALQFFASYQRRLRLAQLTVEELAQLSHSDDLTRLPNRRHMAQALGEALQRLEQAGENFAVLLFDVDHFKAINDQRGHATGDRVLRELARRAGLVFREGDVFGRWGGDEFVALLPSCDAAAAWRRAQCLCEQVAASPLFDGHGVTISCGVVVACTGDDADHLLQRADAALYAAKRAGRNRASGAPDVPVTRVFGEP